MIFGIVKESLEKCVFFINDVLILVIKKKSHFQKLAGEVSILERFRVRTVRNVTPIQGSENDIFMKTRFLAWDVRQKLKNRILAWEVLQKLQIAFPRCMAVKINNDCHAAWECDFSFLRHL